MACLSMIYLKTITVKFYLVTLLLLDHDSPQALFRVPENGLVSACPSVSCLIKFIPEIERRGHVIVAIASVSFQLDPYLSLYLGNIIDLLSMSQRQLHFLLFEWNETNMAETTIMMLSLLPEKSIFVAYEDGLSAFGIYNMAYSRIKFGLGTAVVLHLNHEQPWITKEALALQNNNQTMSVSLPVVESLLALSYYYKSHQTVLRNYYYEPITNDAVYIPTGVPYYGYMFGNESSTINEAIKTPASGRKHFCHFTGRVKYPLDILHEQAQEREVLMTMAEKGVLGRCTIDARATKPEEKISYHQHTYDEYVELLADTAFVLCPSGNNPETFRHFEALEARAIPLFVRPPPDKDYTRYGLWAEYPGPIFKSWKDLKPFLDQMTDEKANALQVRVAAWYKQFRLARKMHIANIIDPALADSTEPTTLIAQVDLDPFPVWGGEEPSWDGIRTMIREAENRAAGYEGEFLRNSRRNSDDAGRTSATSAAADGVRNQCASGCASEEYMVLGQRVASLEAENLALKMFAAELEHRVRQIELGLLT